MRQKMTSSERASESTGSMYVAAGPRGDVCGSIKMFSLRRASSAFSRVFLCFIGPRRSVLSRSSLRFSMDAEKIGLPFENISQLVTVSENPHVDVLLRRKSTQEEHTAFRRRAQNPFTRELKVLFTHPNRSPER